MTDGTRKVYLGTFADGVPTHVFVPKDAFKPAERILDAERKRREKEIAQPKMQALQMARARGRLRRALRACIGRFR